MVPAASDGAAVRLVRRTEQAFDRLFGAPANPLRQLGALAVWLLWIVVASGFWIYALYETGVDGAWRSVQEMNTDQPYTSGLMRGLHRYASDAFVLVSAVHLLREALLGRFRAFRWFTWVSGVPLLWLAVISGIVGYWMVWDERALYVGVSVLEWMSVLPGVTLEVVRNFLDAQAVTDRFFSLLAFLHIGVPLLLLLGLWVHIVRLARPQTQPHRWLAVGTLITLVLLSLFWPALSMPLADPSRQPMVVDLDWFYLVALPLADRAPILMWTVLVLATVLLVALPWWPGSRQGRAVTAPGAVAPARMGSPAVVDPVHCNGCTLCLQDCPYAAVTMVPHPLRPASRMALVDPDLCAACGVCVGACPSATPFRRSAAVTTGIDLPGTPLQGERERLDAALRQLETQPHPRVLVLGCEHAARLSRPLPGVQMIASACTALWPPVFIEYALRHGADGVLVTGCPPGDCEYRLGPQWTAQRLAGERMPHLRAQVPRDRVHLVWAAREQGEALADQIARWRERLDTLPIQENSDD
ncbi:MAG: hydrogenase iron-sulfur subunit [Aquabacterium sp.]|nr:hydrogenase iron-sulfur subunit [Aquabacterium sp.]